MSLLRNKKNIYYLDTPLFYSCATDAKINNLQFNILMPIKTAAEDILIFFFQGKFHVNCLPA